MAKRVRATATAGLLIATLVGVGMAGSPAGALTQAHTPSASAGTQGCGYGQGGASAGALCWLNMSGYNPFLAQSLFGQRMSLPVGDGYTVSFTVRDQKVGSTSFGEVEARDLSTLHGAWLGGKAYRGTPGRPALYQQVSGGTDAVKLSDITVTNGAGEPVPNYNLVVADAEPNDGGESSVYLSDQPLTRFDDHSGSGVCSNGLHGLGTQLVSCSRPTRGDHGNFSLEAKNPRAISALFRGHGESGIAFGLLTSKVTLIKDVATRRNPTDAFEIGVLKAPWTVLARANTGTADSATVGPLNVVPNEQLILKERALPGSGANLSLYSISWSCTDNGKSYAATPESHGAAVEISPQLGDNIVCTVTNAAPVVSGSFVTPEAGIGAAAAVAGLLGFGWLVRRRRRLATS